MYMCIQEAEENLAPLINKETYYPQVLITNIGLHNFQQNDDEIEQEFKQFIRFTDSGSAPIKYIMHSTTPLREKYSEDYINGNNEEIVKYNAVIQRIFNDWEKGEAYLDFYSYALDLQESYANTDVCLELTKKGACDCKRPDGIHFYRWCNYAPIIYQWDFNWIQYLGVIKIKTKERHDDEDN